MFINTIKVACVERKRGKEKKREKEIVCVCERETESAYIMLGGLEYAGVRIV